jgi:hypothetical protein
VHYLNAKNVFISLACWLLRVFVSVSGLAIGYAVFSFWGVGFS